jgi:hypothetical protein
MRTSPSQMSRHPQRSRAVQAVQTVQTVRHACMTLFAAHGVCDPVLPPVASHGEALKLAHVATLRQSAPSRKLVCCGLLISCNVRGRDNPTGSCLGELALVLIAA